MAFLNFNVLIKKKYKESCFAVYKIMSHTFYRINLFKKKHMMNTLKETVQYTVVVA